MTTQLRNLLIFYVLIFGASFAFGQVVPLRLNCQLSIIKSLDNGYSEREQQTQVFEIYQTAAFLAIVPATDAFASVSTFTEKGYKVYDFSDQNKWDLTNEKNSETNQIKIDRNTGQIFYSRLFKATNKESLLIQGNGNCRKIDTDKKLF